MTKANCTFCNATYPDETKQIINEGGLIICSSCWDSILKEKLTAKEYQKRIKSFK